MKARKGFALLHLKKLCVGVSSLQQLQELKQKRRDAFLIHHSNKGQPWFELPTRNRPKRADEILAGGSLYWVIQGFMCARQPILKLDLSSDAQGLKNCQIRMALDLIPLVPRPHRPFQGWRYLEDRDKPEDMDRQDSIQDLPEDRPTNMRRQYRPKHLVKRHPAGPFGSHASD